MRIIHAMTALFLVCSLSHIVASQSSQPWFGVWKLNLAKSTTDREVRYKRATTKIEPWQDGLKVTYDLVGVRGGITHMEWTGKFDGRDYAVEGIDYVLTHAYTPVNDRSYQITIKLDGAVSAIAKVQVSPDGKTLTTLTEGKDAQGKTVSTTTVYDRL